MYSYGSESPLGMRKISDSGIYYSSSMSLPDAPTPHSARDITRIVNRKIHTMRQRAALRSAYSSYEQWKRSLRQSVSLGLWGP